MCGQGVKSQNMRDVSVCTLHRLGEVTLRDVKAAVDREGNYRYHFKALDPEFGTVKEEVRVGHNNFLFFFLKYPIVGMTTYPI